MEELDVIATFIGKYGSLSKTDVEIYLAILKNGNSMSASDIMAFTNKGKNTVYPSLKKLRRAGFIDRGMTTGKRKSSPRIIRVVTPSIIMKQFIELGKKEEKAFRKAMDNIDMGIEENSTANASYLEADGGLWTNISKDISVKSVQKKIEGAKHKICLLGRDCDWSGHVLQELKDASKRGVDVRIIGNFNCQKSKDVFKGFINAGFSEPTNTKLDFVPFCIIDDEYLILAYEIKPDNHVCLNVENIYWIRKFKSLFENIEKWEGKS